MQSRTEKTEKNKKRIFRRLLLAFGILAVLGCGILGLVNWHMIRTTQDRIVTIDTLDGTADCVLVLGAGVRADGSPSPMLADRVTVGLDVFFAGGASRLLMSGDHGSTEYDEVSCMLTLALEAGVSPAEVFLDHAGFSTYESLYRAKEIFGAEKIVIVTQEYHLYRALYIAQALGLDAVGVSADLRGYSGQFMREIREVAARGKDFCSVIWRPEPAYLGEKIPLTGDGRVTQETKTQS